MASSGCHSCWNENAEIQLVIDYMKCRRAGQCSYLHPELFKVNEGGAPVVLVEWPDDQLREAAEEAVELCPNGSVSLKEDHGQSSIITRLSRSAHPKLRRRANKM